MRPAALGSLLASLVASPACLSSPGLLEVGEKPLSLSAPTESVPPRGSFAFAASGGSGAGYRFSLAWNASGGTVDQTTGAYVAGARGSVNDVVQVEDSEDHVAQATVSVGAGVRTSPAGMAMSPGTGPAPFTAWGGSGAGWTWTLARNDSGASVRADDLDPAVGLYTAGPLEAEGVFDLLQVSDSLGNVATARIDVAYMIVLPTSVTLVTGATQTFFAGVHFASNTEVTWEVVEPEGGTIVDPTPPSGTSLAACTYVAPALPGTFQVRATSVADSTRSARAQVTVVPAP